ncbi:MAG: CbiX/SirB N-terminal domain-containing protein, partial [Burkholderiales bacterium]|nr:CbiX/SirB N-terminal domain-containing protein [Burkholderiales bacterium]
MNENPKTGHREGSRSSLIAHRSALVLFAHGARDPEWAEPFRAIATRVAADRKDLTVKLAFLELQTPSLADAIAELAEGGHSSIHIAPLFMAQGGHLKKDVPKLLAEISLQQPGLKIELLQAIGDVPGLRDAIASWLTGIVP